MIGWVTAMEPADYQAWLGGGPSTASPVAAGEKLFNDLACNTCHLTNGTGRGPVLNGIFGKQRRAAGRRHGRSSTRPTSASRS